MSEAVEETPAEVPEPDEPDTDETEEDEEEATPEPENRCEAETTVGGTVYRCALQANHEDNHRWQPLDDAAPAAPAPKSDSRDITDALESEAVRHAARLAEIMGVTVPSARTAREKEERALAVFDGLEGKGIVPCALCPPNFGGWRPDVAPTEAVSQKVRVAIGLPDVSNYAMSSTERVCDDCRGLGKVRTGSLVPGKETSTCDACRGRGWVGSRPRLNEQPAEPDGTEVANGAPPVYDDGIRRDMFGTPEGDPDFEKIPSARIRPVDYWQQHQH
jgi:hypothetical protein